MFHSKQGLRYRGSDAKIHAELARIQSEAKIKQSAASMLTESGELATARLPSNKKDFHISSAGVYSIQDAKAYQSPPPGTTVFYTPGTKPGFLDELLSEKHSIQKLAMSLEKGYDKLPTAEQQLYSGIVKKVAGYHVAQLAMSILGIGPIPLAILSVVMKAQMTTAYENYDFSPGLPADMVSLCNTPPPVFSVSIDNIRHCDELSITNSSMASKNNSLLAHSLVWEDKEGKLPGAWTRCLTADYNEAKGLRKLIQSIIQQPDFAVNSTHECNLYYTDQDYKISQTVDPARRGMVVIENLSQPDCDRLTESAAKCAAAVAKEDNLISYTFIALDASIVIGACYFIMKYVCECCKKEAPNPPAPPVVHNIAAADRRAAPEIELTRVSQASISEEHSENISRDLSLISRVGLSLEIDEEQDIGHSDSAHTIPSSIMRI